MEITEDLVQKKERPVGFNSVVQHPKLAESSRGNRASADSMQLHPGPDLAMWGPRAPSDEGASKSQNKMRDLRQFAK